jgi:hypothetical protein
MIGDANPSLRRIYADTAKGRDVLEGIEPRLYPKPSL